MGLGKVTVYSRVLFVFTLHMCHSTSHQNHWQLLTQCVKAAWLSALWLLVAWFVAPIKEEWQQTIQPDVQAC